jgi:MoaA/NifB/PqqE/SkfB family radical SAM enzyme
VRELDKMATLETIRIGPQCNNQCVYCLSRREKQVEDSAWKLQIDGAVSKKKNGIVIVGGEPTVREDFIDIVSYAKRAGLERITIQTNARLLSNKDYADTLLEAGASDFIVKLWGHTKEIHDRISGVEGSFEETIKGIKNITSPEDNRTILGKSGILMDNYTCLPDLVTLFAGLGVQWMIFELPPTEKRCVPLVPETLEYIHKAAETSNELQTFLGVENIPFCFMRGYEDNVRVNVQQRQSLDDCDYFCFVEPVYDENKTKPPPCQQCRYFPLCEGILKTYVEESLTSGIKPIEEDKKRRAFERVEDLKGKEEVFYPLVEPTEIPDGLKADAIVHFSGGIDSTISTALYARKHREKKIVLITYRHSGLLNFGSARINSSYLMKKFPNVVDHLFIPLPEELHVPLCFGRDYNEHVKRLQGNYGCIACNLLMYSCSTYLHKVFFGGDTILTGFNVTQVPGRAATPTPQVPKVVTLIKDFVCRYGIQCVNPVYAVSNKQRIVFLAKEMGLPTVRVFQFECILSFPVICRNMDPMIQFVDTEIAPILHKILKINLKRSQ